MMQKPIIPRRIVVAVCVALLCAFTAQAGEEASPVELVSVEKIWDQGQHNAFTDLIRFQGKWFCSFREGAGHVFGEDGKIRVIVSEDGKTWKSAALMAEEGIDLRDPKLSITPDGRLMMNAGGSVYEGKKFITRQPRVAFSEDGFEWGPTIRICQDGDWLWRVTWHKDKAYGFSRAPIPQDGAEGTSEEWQLTLYVSDDGIDYTPVCKPEVPGKPNETTVRFMDDDTMIALVRREGGSTNCWIGTSKPPYTDWSWHETGYRIGGPNFIILPDGSMWAGGRYYPGGAKTVLAKFGPETYEPVLTLPSGGDNSYPGFVWHEGLLWMSYYSSHEGKTTIYLAKIRIKE
jgi:hypothetical protein